MAKLIKPYFLNSVDHLFVKVRFLEFFSISTKNIRNINPFSDIDYAIVINYITMSYYATKYANANHVRGRTFLLQNICYS